MTMDDFEDKIKMSTQYVEPHLLERVKRAKDHAHLIKDGKNIESVDDLELSLRYILSKHYNMPIFHEYFEKRTLDELFFEAELIVYASKSSTDVVSDAIKENENEINQLADEMESEWNNMAEDKMLEQDPLFQMAKEFMETGKFLNEKNNFGFVAPDTEENQQPEEQENDDNWK